MAQFSIDLKELEAVNALSTLSQVYETQMLDTQAIMHELSTESEVTFRKVLGWAKILPTRPGIDPFGETRPMYTLSGGSNLQLSPVASTSPSVIAARPAHGLASYLIGYLPITQDPTTSHWSHHTEDPSRPLHLVTI